MERATRPVFISIIALLLYDFMRFGVSLKLLGAFSIYTIIGIVLVRLIRIGLKYSNN